ncbi:MAG: hypothetical protein R3B13_39385 [Polyangiaceae bacterium]
MNRRGFVLGSALLAACGPRSVGPPPPAPAGLARPEAALPPELDLGFRLDLARVRGALGHSALVRMRQQAAERMGGQPEHERMIADLLLHSDVMLLALRPSIKVSQLDHVLICRGRLGDFEPRSYALEPRFGPAMDLGADLRRHDRDSRKRIEPARIYLSAADMVVLVTPAAIDSVERRVEEGVLDAALEPPAKGLLSVAARGPALAQWVEGRSTRLAALLSQSKEVSGHADLNAASLVANVTLTVDDGETATAIADALRTLGRAFAELVPRAEPLIRAVRVSAVDAKVVLDIELPIEQLEPFVRDDSERKEAG